MLWRKQQQIIESITQITNAITAMADANRRVIRSIDWLCWDRMQVLLTNDDGIEAEGLQAIRRALLRCRASSSRSSRPTATARAVCARDHHAPPAVGRGGRLRRRHGRLRDRRHAGRLRAPGQARAGRGLRRRDRRLGHQPRLQPRRRHHLLGHRRGRARGARARDPGDRRLPAVARARDGLPPRPPLRLRARRGLHRARRRGARRRAAARRHAAQHQRPRRASPRASRSRASASASTATSSSSTRTRRRPAPYWIYGDDPGFHDEEGTDLAAVAARHIAVTPVHFDLTDRPGIDALEPYDLARLLAPAAPRGASERADEEGRRARRRAARGARPTTATATTCSTTRSSPTTSTTRCSTSCARSRPSTPSCSRPTRRPSASAASRSRS